MNDTEKKTSPVEGVDYELNRQNLESLKVWTAYGLGFGGCIGWLLYTFGNQLGTASWLSSWGIPLGLGVGAVVGALAFCIIGVIRMRRERKKKN